MHTVTLRYDPGAPSTRGVEVWHEGKFIERARLLDAYANCRVRRHRPTQGIDADGPAPAPRGSGLALHELQRRDQPGGHGHGHGHGHDHDHDKEPR